MNGLVVFVLLVPVVSLFLFGLAAVVAEAITDKRRDEIKDLRRELRRARDERDILKVEPGKNLELYRLVKSALDERDAEIAELRNAQKA